MRTIGWYGMTETVTHPVIDDRHSPGHPLGMARPAPGYDIAVLGEGGSPAAVGETGDLYVRGVPGLSLFACYLHDEQATRSTVDEHGWLYTRDRATIHEDGFLSFADRANDVLKVGGENVSATEVEWVVMAVSGVSEVAVVGAPHPMLDEVPIAFVISDG
jgi:crotonobetaine/carnitine-CoA ligase